MLHVTVEDVHACHTHISTVLRDGDFPKAPVQSACRQEYGATVVFVHDPSGVLFLLFQWGDRAAASNPRAESRDLRLSIRRC